MQTTTINLKKVITAVAFMLFSVLCIAQGFQQLDEAPHDISYLRATKLSKPLAKVLYGRPSHVSDDEVFGTKIPFDQLWRTGANEATEVKFYKDVVFGDKVVAAGTYVLLTIPNKDNWEIILSSNLDVLGAFQYDPVFDVARIQVPVKKAEKLDTFSIAFKQRRGEEDFMVLAWGSTRVHIPMNFKEQDYFAVASKTDKKLNRI